ncbi:MAG: hypothetical protein EAX96_16355 [Candidatus Lokiarchaeota archaeon]|nr:hypothetical protein [Candidatus Lokiarchaeota archaeon]
MDRIKIALVIVGCVLLGVGIGTFIPGILAGVELYNSPAIYRDHPRVMQEWETKYGWFINNSIVYNYWQVTVTKGSFSITMTPKNVANLRFRVFNSTGNTIILKYANGIPITCTIPENGVFKIEIVIISFNGSNQIYYSLNENWWTQLLVFPFLPPLLLSEFFLTTLGFTSLVIGCIILSVAIKKIH